MVPMLKIYGIGKSGLYRQLLLAIKAMQGLEDLACQTP